jgi:hypothetical protein
MLRKLLVVTGLALALGAGTAAAHDYTIHYTHLAALAVPAVAQDKDVVGVTARVGVLATANFLPGMPHQHYPVTPFWAGERKLSLAKAGDHFFAKVQLNATEMPPGPRMGPVMVQFTLSFADGSTLVLREDVLKVSRQHNTSSYDDYNRDLAAEMKIFNETVDATTCSVATVSVYRRGPDAW